MLKILGNENMIDEKQIQDWLVEEGIFRQKIPDDNSNFQNSFMLDFELEHPNDELKRFIITDFIFEDGLTKDRLISTIKKIFKGKLHCIWLLGKTYGQVNPNSEAPASRDNMFV